MLLTKPMTALLSSSLSPPLTTLCLLSPSGQILASASNLPSSILRSRATLAVGVWEVYELETAAIEAATSEATTEREDGDEEGDQPGKQYGGGDEKDGKEGRRIKTITLQLSHGIVSLRKLSCGLLVMGLSDTSSTDSHTQQTHQSSHHLVNNSKTPSNVASPATSHPRSNQGSFRGRTHMVGSPPTHDGGYSAGASDAGSVGTVTGRGREVQALRRRTDEVGRWLERELIGYRPAEGF